MITKDNLRDALPSFSVKDFPENLKMLHFFVMEASEQGTNWNALENSDVKEMVDEYFSELNKFLEKKSPENLTVVEKPVTKTKGKAKAPREPKINTKAETSEIKTNVPKLKFVPNEHEDDIELVERIPDEIRFIKRYLSLNGKRKTKEDVLRFITALQRAIVEKKLRKASPFAKEIEHIQKKLVDRYNEMKRPMTIDLADNTIAKFKEIVHSQKVFPSVLLLKRYIQLNGKFGVKDQAKRLLDAMKKAIDLKKVSSTDKYKKLITGMMSNLQSYLKGKGQAMLSIEQTELNGLNGVLQQYQGQKNSSVTAVKKPQTDRSNKGAAIMYLADARNANFKTIGLSGEWRNLIGNACKPTHILAYGEGGSGKSSLMLTYSTYLNSLGFKVLYVAGEEFNTPTFTDLVKRLNISANEDFVIVKDLSTLNLADFDFVALDSKDSLGIEVEDFRQLKKDYPNQSFIISSQGTKSGNFTGSGQWKNEVDTMIHCENGVARTMNNKNRWGGKGEMHLFNDHSYKQAA